MEAEVFKLPETLNTKCIKIKLAAVEIFENRLRHQSLFLWQAPTRNTTDIW